MKKTNTTAKNQALEASEIFAILKGETPFTPTKANINPTKEELIKGEKRARAFLKSLQPKKYDGTKEPTLEGVTDFEVLANFVTKHFEGATATKKAVRFKTAVARFSVWRRANNVRIYTNNPKEIEGVEWVPDTHETGLTHSGYTDCITIIDYLKTE